jgi:hypothetical protein
MDNLEIKKHAIIEAILIAAGTCLVNYIFEEIKDYQRRKRYKEQITKDKSETLKKEWTI